MRRTRRAGRAVGVALVATVLLGACSGDDDGDATVDSSSVDGATPSSTDVPPTSGATTTDAPTTTAAATTSTTTSTEAAPATTDATATTQPPEPTTTAPAAGSLGVAYAVVDDDLVELDLATGDIVTTIVDGFSGEGVFRGPLRLTTDRTTIWFSQNYEDGFYDCDSSKGAVGRVDVATGAIEDFVVGGSSPAPSADGGRVAYLASEVCVPDPANAEFWVLTPADRVIVEDVATREIVEVFSDTSPDSYEAPSAITWVGWSGPDEVLVSTADGRLRRVDLGGPAVLQQHPVVVDDLPGDPVAVLPDAVLTAVTGDEGAVDLSVVSLIDGSATTIASSERSMSVGVDADGRIAIVSDGPVSTFDPDIVVGTAPSDRFLYDLDW